MQLIRWAQAASGVAGRALACIRSLYIVTSWTLLVPGGRGGPGGRASVISTSLGAYLRPAEDRRRDDPISVERSVNRKYRATGGDT